MSPRKSIVTESYTEAIAGLAMLAKDLEASGQPELAARARNILGRLGWVATAVAHA